MKKFIILTLFIVGGFLIGMNAQVVKEKPKAPEKVVKQEEVQKPSTNANWNWVAAEWEWKSTSKDYKFIQPHWAKAPENKNRWNQGYWKKVKDGWKWIEGFWE